MSAGSYDFDDNEVTFTRKPVPTPATARPLVVGAPAAFTDVEEGEGSWEKSVARDVLVGKQLGDYVVKRRIGAGGMGIVYEGEHPVIGRKVAIKILRPDFAEGARSRDLASEARAAAAIRHRGIIDIFGFGSIPGLGQYLVMEYLDGAPLDEIIAQRAPMLEVEVVTVLDDLLGALGAAHAAGVIHRDLKPGNVFVVRDGSGNEYVKVLDFGLAKRAEAPNSTTPQTRASMMVGTPEYMAPEQACGQQVGPHTDLYAVGVIAFEMLTRRLPFEGPSPMAIAVHHVRTPPPLPSQYVDLNPELESLVMRLLAKTPEERPASAEAVRRELKVILKQLSGDATQLSQQPRGGAPSTVSQEAVAVPAPAPRVRTDRFAAPPGRRPGSAPGPRRATPAPTAPTAPDLLAVDATDLDLSAVGSGRSRAVMFGAGGAVLLALLAVGGVWTSRDTQPAATMPPLREMAPTAATPPVPVEAPRAPRLEMPASDARPSEDSAPQDTLGDVHAAGGQKPVLAATILAKDTQPSRASEDEPARPTRRPARAVGATREGRASARTHSSTETQPAPAVPGVLTLQVTGYVKEVLVDGQSQGRTRQLELSPGVHKLEVRGNTFTLPYSSPVTILSGERTEHHVVLEPIP
ncbi:serine/threonine protein kinase [Pyxidicoccus sp. MSG2]|uniref:serine/threonine protein kinase n=1 Tax=Pyxidicoccus sp. MSG2 TaxID=2996790 RepID=UPI002271345F|nr:serine/threonine-protein kinase [Pyxidicoccus sp. MSG2]MCY1016822.1 protein kinase [Pyxidicoccus sp. MSG2]